MSIRTALTSLGLSLAGAYAIKASRRPLPVVQEPVETYRPEHNDKQVLKNVHPSERCLGEHCTIHNRSDHHMRSWKQWWRRDILLMERICPHGVGHPDPDDPNAEMTIHGCDGCCRPTRAVPEMVGP